jgi:hypothetical protein
MNKIKTDRSGKISTVLLAVIVIIIVAIVAVALYVILTGDDNDEGYQMPDDDNLGPGTMVEYSITDSTDYKSMKMEFIGQSNENFFLKVTAELITESGTQTIIMNMTQPRINEDSSKITGTQVMDTIDGKKTLYVVEVTSDEETITEYIDQKTGLPYKMVYPDMTATLTDYKLVEQQGPYEQSDAIGLTYEYTFKSSSGDYTAKVMCIADCENGQYGILCDLTSEVPGLVLYYISAKPLGVPTDAIDSGTKTTLDTIDGRKSVEIWGYQDILNGIMLGFGYDPISNTVYEIDAIFSNGVAPFVLSDKNPTNEPDTDVS